MASAHASITPPHVLLLLTALEPVISLDVTEDGTVLMQNAAAETFFPLEELADSKYWVDLNINCSVDL